MTIKIIQTGDIHGCFFPHDFLKRKEATASLSHISSYIKKQRETFGDRLILLDLGDIMQGQPTCYRSLNISDAATNLSAELLNRLGYDAVCIGNHDIETGHKAYDKWAKETNADILAANAIRISDGSPYFKPYKKIVVGNIKIVIIGLLTNAIPYWLSQRLWKGMHFENPVESAGKWMKAIKKTEKPDIIIGLFHTGWEGGVVDGDVIENATKEIAEEIDGFDIILFGHDHIARNLKVTNSYGHDVICMNASSNATYVNDVEIDIELADGDNACKARRLTTASKYNKTITAKQIRTGELPIDTGLTTYYKMQIDEARRFTEKAIGKTETELRTRDCYFGDSPLAALIHQIQLEVTGAQISFTAPLAYDETINKGTVTIADIFNIYKYENTIVSLEMKGREVKKYLEHSYALWVNRMTDSTSRLLNVSECQYKDRKYCYFKNLTFNFDTAYGICYTVDVRKEPGNMISIISMANGDEFREEATYSVAMHSYRANGGNEFLTKGVGIPHSDLSKRKIFESDKDERYYIIEKFLNDGIVSPTPAKNWRFIPEDWTSDVIRKERRELFGDE